MNLLLIDGNNLAHRVHWTHKNLSYDGMPVSLLYGFFSSLKSLKKKFPGYLPVIAWDRGYARRKRESEDGVRKGIIPEAYKENRHKLDEEIPPDVEIVYEQMEPLKEALKLARVVQVEKDGYEGDDIICTYVKRNSEKGGKNVIVTSDKDFLQLLDENTEIYDSMKSVHWTRDLFVEQYGFEPYLWVDVGALAGDSSDNIFGVNGVGEKYASKYVKEYGEISSIIDGLEKKEKKGKRDKAVIGSENKVRLAYSLKHMDIVPDLPSIRCGHRNPKSLLEWFKQFEFDTLYDAVDILTR